MSLAIPARGALLAAGLAVLTGCARPGLHELYRQQGWPAVSRKLVDVQEGLAPRSDLAELGELAMAVRLESQSLHRPTALTHCVWEDDDVVCRLHAEWMEARTPLAASAACLRGTTPVPTRIRAQVLPDAPDGRATLEVSGLRVCWSIGGSAIGLRTF